MSADADDEELSKLNRAAEFLSEARERMSVRYCINGSLPEEEKRLIKEETAEAIAGSGLTRRIKESLKTRSGVDKLAEMFGKTCSRIGMDIDPQLRPAIIKILACEFYANRLMVRGCSQVALCPFTIRYGELNEKNWLDAIRMEVVNVHSQRWERHAEQSVSRAAYRLQRFYSGDHDKDGPGRS